MKKYNFQTYVIPVSIKLMKGQTQEKQTDPNCNPVTINNKIQ